MRTELKFAVERRRKVGAGLRWAGGLRRRCRAGLQAGLQAGQVVGCGAGGMLLAACLLGVSTAGEAQGTTTAGGQTGAAEALDLQTISRLREEGMNHSHVMAYASELADEVGPRLTGSPEFERGAQWAMGTLRGMGLTEVHEESWGEFGTAWTQVGTTLLLQAPVPGTLNAQATPWSPATNGEVTAEVVLVPELATEEAMTGWRGKLRGKVVLYGAPPPIDPNPPAPLVPADEAYFKARMSFPQPGQSQPMPELDLEGMRRQEFQSRVARFFVEEGAVGVLVSPRGGDGETFHDDTSLGWLAFQREHRQPIASAVVSPDGYGRLARLAARGVPVTVRLNIQARFGNEHAEGENVLGEIAGTDPALKDQVVMLGGHLDSWASGTGATDDGGGVLVALEALRILKACGVRPRRTIRVGLWGGEEQGMIGSMRFVDRHLARVERGGEAAWSALPEWEQPVARVTPRADFDRMDVYFNVDAGAGRILGIYAENNLGAAEVFRQWVEPVRDLGFERVSLQAKRSIDSVRFDEAGLPGFEFMQDIRDYDRRTHHTNLDTYERLNEPDLKQAATVMAIFVFNAAQRDGMMPRKAAVGLGAGR